MNVILKPCPFCGGKAVLSMCSDGDDESGYYALHSVYCINGFASRGMTPSWEFWDDMDVRTIVEVGKVLGIDPKRDMPFEGVKHDALADAIHQAKYVSLIWQTINILR